jgi:predicted NBD/HSP70 family sugar kinase
VTVSEGIGVGLLVNGQLLHGGHAMAGEFGHVTIDEEGPPCPCGKRGCWERYASNSAAVQHYVHGPASDVAEIPRFEDLLRFADHGDRRAILALERMARFLGFGLAGLATGLAPEVIVVIGEMTAAWDRLGPIILDEVTKRSLPFLDTRIIPTDPATQPRLRGAVTLVVQQHFGAPTVA